MPPSTSEDLTIHVTIMGYRSYSAPLEFDGNPIVIRLEEGTFQLREVTVKADPIRESGDTITYTVGSFAQKQDRTIGDVLKRMPGIDVAKNGEVPDDNHVPRNNTGLNLSDQLLDFSSNRSDEELERNRNYFNRSWMVSSSHLLKTKNGGEFKAQIDYNHDRVSAEESSSTTYFLESGDKIILEDKNSLSRRNALTGKFSYEVNEKSYYLNNTLSADFSWNDLTLNTTGSLLTTQSAWMPEYAVSNLLSVIKRFGNNKLVTFTSRNEWNSLPEKLTVNHEGQDYGQESLNGFCIQQGTSVS